MDNYLELYALDEALNYLNEDLDIDLNDNKYLSFNAAEKSIVKNIKKIYPKVLEIFKADKDLNKLSYDQRYNNYYIYPMNTITIDPRGYSHDINYKIDNDKFKYFYGSIFYMYFSKYIINILDKYIDKDGWKDVDEKYLTINNYNKFKSFCDNKLSIIKPKIESLIPEFIEVYIEYPTDSEVKERIKDGNLVVNICFKINDNYTAKLLGVNKSEDDRFAKIVSKIKEIDKQKLISLYNSVLNWISDPHQITGKMNISFDDIISIIRNKLIDCMTIQKLTSIIVSNKNNFNNIPVKTLISEEMDERYLKSKLGNDIRLIQDYHSGSGDYVILAKNNLWWVNIEHNELESNIINLPFGSIFDDYDNKLLKYILDIK